MLTVASAAAAVLGLSQSASAANPPTASATIQTTGTGAVNTYALTLKDAAASPSAIGTFWFAWIPGEDFMTSIPSGITSPTGWSASVTGGGANNGYAILWTAGTEASDVPIGGSLSGFGFSSTDTPASLAGNSQFYPTTPTMTSVSYSGAIFSDLGTTFVVPASEPISLAALIPAGLLFCRRSRQQ